MEEGVDKQITIVEHKLTDEERKKKLLDEELQ